MMLKASLKLGMTIYFIYDLSKEAYLSDKYTDKGDAIEKLELLKEASKLLHKRFNYTIHTYTRTG